MDLERDLLTALGLTKKHGMTPRQLMRLLAAAQGGQFATRQAGALGVKPSQVHALRDADEVTWVRQGVWRFRSAPGAADPAVTAFLACWPHAVISHASAAQSHGLSRVAKPDQAVVTIKHGRTCRPAGVTVHRSKELESPDILRVGPVRYTSLARTVCDLADADDPWETLSILDDAVAAGAKRGWIHQRANALRAGRTGVSLVARATHPQASSEFRSWLERAAAHVFDVAGLPDAEWNVEVRDAAGRIGIVDAVWRFYGVVVELKGLRFHASPGQVQRDDRRLNRLFDAQYTVRQIQWADLATNPVGVAKTVARALQIAGAAVDPATLPSAINVPARPFL